MILINLINSFIVIGCFNLTRNMSRNISNNLLENNLFVKGKQKNLNEGELWDIMAAHLSHCIASGECRNIDNRAITSCDCVKRVKDKSGVWNMLIEALIEYNSYDNKNRTLYLKGIALQGFTVKQNKQRSEWAPWFYISFFLDGDMEQYFVCQNGLRNIFNVGYKQWKRLTPGLKVPMP